MTATAALTVDYPADALAIAVQVVTAATNVDRFDTEVDVEWSHHPATEIHGAVLFGTAVVTRSCTRVLGRVAS